jgi:predicted phage-related endonuclease
MLGCWTEEFNRLWYEKLSGQKVDRLPTALTCPTNSWRRCTLDGYIAQTDTIFEAKHTTAFAKAEEVLERYMPQLQHNMAVARVERAVLSVIFGNHKYEMFEVASDWVYQIELLQAEADFWDCVETGRQPSRPCPLPRRSRSGCARSASRGATPGRRRRPTGSRIARRPSSMPLPAAA